MQQFVLFAVSVALGFFAILNPVGNTPVFMGLVEGYNEATRRHIAKKATLVAFCIVAIFTIFGNIIFKVFGITLPAFQIAGGILLFSVGYNLLNGRESNIHHPTASDKESFSETENIAISPIGIPILAGPGVIATTMNYAGTHSSISHLIVIISMLGLVCIATYYCFISGQRIVAVLGKSIIKVITRLMGLIIAVISVEMVITGVKNAIVMFQ